MKIIGWTFHLDIMSYNFTPCGRAGKLTIKDLFELIENRKNWYHLYYSASILSESPDVTFYYNRTIEGQKLLEELYIEAMYTKLI